MIEFIDKTQEQSGTPLNRFTMMALQGFIAKETAFGADGNITQTNSNGDVLRTVFNEDGSITEIFEGEKIITKTTTFGAAGNITEVIS